MFTRKYWVRGRWLIVFAVLAVLLEVYIVWSNNANASVVGEQKNVLQKQASQLAHPAGDQLVQEISAGRSASAFITQVYCSPLAFDDLREFYSAGFVKSGFVVMETNLRSTPDMDGVKATVSFCKGDYTATLRYKGVTDTKDQETDKWTYAIDLSWWSRGCDPR